MLGVHRPQCISPLVGEPLLRLRAQNGHSWDPSLSLFSLLDKGQTAHLGPGL